MIDMVLFVYDSYLLSSYLILIVTFYDAIHIYGYYNLTR